MSDTLSTADFDALTKAGLIAYKNGRGYSTDPTATVEDLLERVRGRQAAPVARTPPSAVMRGPTVTRTVRVPSSERHHCVKGWVFGFLTGVVLVCWIGYVVVTSGALR
jgi:hypothetical protein